MARSRHKLHSVARQAERQFEARREEKQQEVEAEKQRAAEAVVRSALGEPEPDVAEQEQNIQPAHSESRESVDAGSASLAMRGLIFAVGLLDRSASKLYGVTLATAIDPKDFAPVEGVPTYEED